MLYKQPNKFRLLNLLQLVLHVTITCNQDGLARYFVSIIKIYEEKEQIAVIFAAAIASVSRRNLDFKFHKGSAYINYFLKRKNFISSLYTILHC